MGHLRDGDGPGSAEKGGADGQVRVPEARLPADAHAQTVPKVLEGPAGQAAVTRARSSPSPLAPCGRNSEAQVYISAARTAPLPPGCWSFQRRASVFLRLPASGEAIS